MPIRTVDELSQMGPIFIDRIDAFRVSIPMVEPFRISSGEVSCKDAILVRLSHNGNFGWGESSSMPGAFYSQDTPDSCERQLIDDALPRLAGMRFGSMGELEALLISWKLSPFVRVAIEGAAWELLARAESLSLREFFGLEDRPVPTGLAVGLYPSLAELKAALERYRVLDYARLKIKIKRGHDVELVKAIRDWYGDIPLFVDANADYSEETMTPLFALDAFHLMMIEQPFARTDIDLSRQFQRQVQTPLCFDEGIDSVGDVHLAASLDACRIVNIKLQRVGGFLEAFRIIEACVERTIPFWMGTMPELGIGSAQALVLATHPACAFPTDVEPSSRWYVDDILQPELTMRDKTLRLPSGSGLGFVIDEDRLGKYTVCRWQF